MKSLRLLALIFLIPILISVFSRLPIFKYSPGDFESWISYWGSYLGAIIGASVVYFVSKKQIESQNKIQLESIKLDNKANLKREMKQFYLTNQLKKIEEMNEITNQLMNSNTSFTNDLLSFSIVKSALNDGLHNERRQELEEKIKELRENYFFLHGELHNSLFRLSVLLNYLPAAMGSFMELQKSFARLLDEIRKCYYSEDIYKNYLVLEKGDTFISKNSQQIYEELIHFNIEYLEAELMTIIEEIMLYAND